MGPIAEIHEIEAAIARSRLHLLYVSEATCSVAGAVWPKIEALLEGFPQVATTFVTIDQVPGLAGRFSIFSAPVVLLHVEGQEVFRQGRFIRLGELEAALRRFTALLD